jgi:branched-chain amino acid aminotransferase
MTITLWKVHFTPHKVDLIPLEVPQDASSLDAISARLPAGAYTTFRTFQGNKALCLTDHFDRLADTARLFGHPVPLDYSSLRSALRQVVMHSGHGQDLRLRLTLDLEREPGTTYITAEPLHTPGVEAYQLGVKAVTVAMQRQLPKAKLTRFIERAAPVRQALPKDINEAIMVDEQGRLLEGLSSNFFAWQEGSLWTAESGVLPGITRSLVLACAGGLNLPVRYQPVLKSEIPSLAEAFITSSSRAVLPVRQIDDIPVGAGRPGPVTIGLMKAYDERIQKIVEPI